MKKILCAFMAVMALMLLFTACDEIENVTDTAAQGSEVSGSETSSVELADDFSVYDQDLKKVRLSDHFGKPIVINFWATWCGPCRSELPAFDAMYQKYGDKVTFLMINLTDGYNDTVGGVKEFIADSDYTFPVYYDTEYSAANAYEIYSIPETVFIKADGSVYDIRIGAMSEDALESYIKQLIGG